MRLVTVPLIRSLNQTRHIRENYFSGPSGDLTSQAIQNRGRVNPLCWSITRLAGHCCGGQFILSRTRDKRNNHSLMDHVLPFPEFSSPMQLLKPPGGSIGFAQLSEFWLVPHTTELRDWFKTPSLYHYLLDSYQCIYDELSLKVSRCGPWILILEL